MPVAPHRGESGAWARDSERFHTSSKAGRQEWKSSNMSGSSYQFANYVWQEQLHEVLGDGLKRPAPIHRLRPAVPFLLADGLADTLQARERRSQSLTLSTRR